MMPKAGGQYIYLREAFNPMIGFLFGWTVFTVIQTGVIAAVAIAFATYTGELIPWFSSENVIANLGFIQINTKQLLAILLIVFLTFINLKGVRNGKIVQTVFTLAKILALLGLILAGFYVGMNSDVFQANLQDFWKPYTTTVKDGVVTIEMLSGIVLWGVVGAAMVGSLFSLDSWNNITYIAGEVKNPERTIPMSLFL
jgi:APA family basic amino acid/polyamine antiporter